jgi:hypothetical protein
MHQELKASYTSSVRAHRVVGVQVRVVMGGNKEAAHSAALALKSVALLKALAAAGLPYAFSYECMRP